MTAGTEPDAAGDLSGLSLAQFGARLMLEQLTRIAKHEPGTRAGHDPEELHKMRVATRRLRTAFAVFGKALASAGLETLPVEETKRVAAALGAVRDQDVFLAWLDAQGAEYGDDSIEAHGAARLREQRLALRAVARTQLEETLDGPDRTAIGPALLPLLVAVADSSSHGKRIKKNQRVRRGGRRLVEREYRCLVKRGAALFAPTPDELHRVRIAAKRYRYVLEFLRPVFPEADETIGAEVETATAIQDALGELHDAQIAEAALIDDAIAAGEDGDARAAAGIAALARTQRFRAAAALTRFKEVWEQLE